MGNPVPSLDSNGYITGVGPKADRAFAYYLVSEHSQTLAHQGHIKSFPYTLATYAKDPVELRIRVKNEVAELFKQYFDEADIEVQIREILDNGNPTSKLDIRIFAILTENNVRYSLGKLIDTVDGKVRQVTNYNERR